MSSLFVVGCTSKENPEVVESKEVNLDEIHEAVKAEFGEDYVANTALGENELESLMGISKENIKNHIAEVPMISVHVDTFVAIEAVDEKAGEVEEALISYRDGLVEQSIQYPMNLAKVNASKVVRHGDYVFFLMLGAFDEREDASEEEVLSFAADEIRKAEEAIAIFFE